MTDHTGSILSTFDSLDTISTFLHAHQQRDARDGAAGRAWQHRPFVHFPMQRIMTLSRVALLTEMCRTLRGAGLEHVEVIQLGLRAAND